MNSTLVQWLEFKSSHVWKDMKESVEEEMKLLQIDLEDPTSSLDTLRHIQGKLFAMRHFLIFPDTAIMTLEMEIEERDAEASRQTKPEEEYDGLE